ncbi:PREDICTED: protein TIFY 8-like [Brassica oleracea var. oleracea]|uniref:protein TIFY 8-like n=1 Tax=Brassica oleracea var. oleracea TaxID=109376 RepID=UPI0006A6D008|nr:PREDICTED: protein TIFY 8-like [Brassica oleracea var. oleracea]
MADHYQKEQDKLLFHDFLGSKTETLASTSMADHYQKEQDKLLFHDFLGSKTETLASTSMADHFQKEQDKPLFDYFIELRFTMILMCRRRSFERQGSGGGNHLDGRQLLGPRSEVSGSIMSNRFSGNKRSNSDSQFTAQDHPETLHWSKMLRNGPGSLSMNMNHMANQPPRGGGGQISHLLHQLSSSRFKDENVVPSVISQTAADEGSRTGMKCPGVMSPFTMPNPSRLECFTPSRCDVSSLVMLCPQPD